MKYTKTRILVFLLWYIPFFISATGDKFFNLPSSMMINWVRMSYPALAVFLLVLTPLIYFGSFTYRRFHGCICFLLCADGLGSIFWLPTSTIYLYGWEDVSGLRAYFWKPLFDAIGLNLKENDLFGWGHRVSTMLPVLVACANIPFLITAFKTKTSNEGKRISLIQVLRVLREWKKWDVSLIFIGCFTFFVVFLVIINEFSQEVRNAELDAQIQQKFSQHLEATESGNVSSMAYVGICYWHGHGTKYNTAEALRWWENAAQNGAADAMVELGRAYYSGYRTGRDWDKARYWLNAAIETDPDKEKNARMILDRIDKGLLPFFVRVR